MMNTQFIKSYDCFKNFMLSNNVPSYVSTYCGELSEHQWLWFYGQMKEPVTFVKDITYLFYILKWILKENFDDLSFSVFIQNYTDTEGRGNSIKDDWHSILYQRYEHEIEDFILDQYHQHCLSDLLMHNLDEDDELPF